MVLATQRSAEEEGRMSQGLVHCTLQLEQLVTHFDTIVFTKKTPLRGFLRDPCEHDRSNSLTGATCHVYNAGRPPWHDNCGSCRHTAVLKQRCKGVDLVYNGN